jgi:hypothetical protein
MTGSGRDVPHDDGTGPNPQYDVACLDDGNRIGQRSSSPAFVIWPVQ